ncbi:MAG: hypothetical protein SOH81_06345 [Acetobacter sp.]|jgi:hypothetical protein
MKSLPVCRQNFRSVLTISSILAPWLFSGITPAKANSDDQSLEIMERQITQIQEQQAKLTNALVAMKRQLAARKAAASTGAHVGTLSKNSREYAEKHMKHFATANTTVWEEDANGQEQQVTEKVSNTPDITPVFKGDVPERDIVMGRRDGDVLAHLAENHVGPHPRETVGAQLAGAVGDHGVFHMGPLTIALGGFLDAAAVYRNRDTATDVFNYWQALPFANDPSHHTNSFQGTARYSRFSMLATGKISQTETVSGFSEVDFGAGAATTDAYESNSYSVRLRQAYLAYDNSHYNIHILAGQAWSMLTPGRAGITPRQESLPETIESSMLAGQTWARQWQVRVVKDFLNHRVWAGLSIENPQTLYDTTGYTNNDGAVTLPDGRIATISKNGTGLTNDAPFSSEVAPDVIGKLAFDPEWGHYEIEGILHFPHDRVSTLGSGQSHTVVAGGGGASAILPLIPHKLELRLTGLAGVGIGRYGSVLLPDAVISPSGKPTPLPTIQATAGLIAHPTPRLDVYSYFGTQHAGRRSFSADGSYYGYGNPNYSNAGCDIELSTLACTGNTRAVTEVAVGAWWRFFKGRFGTVQAGTELSWSERQAWEGIGGHPSTSVSQIFFDFRYLPFQ